MNVAFRPTTRRANYGLAKAALFSIAFECPNTRGSTGCAGSSNPSEAVQMANAEILRIVPWNAAGVPVLDLVFLGMGEDGHVASLFPGNEVAAAESAYAVVLGPKPPNPRLTLTYPVLAVAPANLGVGIRQGQGAGPA